MRSAGASELWLQIFIDCKKFLVALLHYLIINPDLFIQGQVSFAVHCCHLNNSAKSRRNQLIIGQKSKAQRLNQISIVLTFSEHISLHHPDSHRKPPRAFQRVSRYRVMLWTTNPKLV